MFTAVTFDFGCCHQICFSHQDRLQNAAHGLVSERMMADTKTFRSLCKCQYFLISDLHKRMIARDRLIL